MTGGFIINSQDSKGNYTPQVNETNRYFFGCAHLS